MMYVFKHIPKVVSHIITYILYGEVKDPSAAAVVVVVLLSAWTGVFLLDNNICRNVRYLASLLPVCCIKYCCPDRIFTVFTLHYSIMSSMQPCIYFAYTPQIF